ncbi:MAG: transcriptional regulator PpsR [Proteobacteria bacterium SG_bin5]|nr:transcriptional regulator PpsR [Sphingomonas sp.]OQW42995.1 MAG: transcriptional regulator PpsR [Proteobacteria bacterium SG_bin5]
MNRAELSIEARAFRDAAALGALDSGAVAALLAAVGDLTFVLDGDGRITDLAIGDPQLTGYGFHAAIGQPFIETVTIEGRGKIVEMLSEAALGVPARWRQVTHATVIGELPVRYLIVALSDGRFAAIGRDLREAAALQQRLLQAQQSLERDYLRLRQAEARYRLLFDMASEPVLIVDAATRRIREANSAATRALAAKPGALVDQPVSSIVDPEEREALVAHLGAVEASDEVPPLGIKLRGGALVRVAARLFRQARAALLLVRLAPAEETPGASGGEGWGDVIERMPDAFVVTDRQLVVRTANAAFLELVQLPTIDRAIGARLDAWVGRPGVDVELIAGQLRDHGTVRNVASVLRGVDGGQEEIEISGVAAPSPEGDCFGFTIRAVGRRLRDLPPPGDKQLPRSVEQLTELVGRMSLKEIVRESTDLIERLCIEAALAYTSDNRASAAEVLGVSRQSLYSKLHRHGLGNLVSDDE